MASAREREIVQRIRLLIGADGGYLIKTSGEGEPDLVGSYRGFAVAIECKQKGKPLSPLQQAKIRRWKRAGAIAFGSDFPAEALQIVQIEAEKRIQKLAKEQQA